MDCTQHQGLCSRHGVQGYPTIVLFPFKNHRSPEPYQRDRTARALVPFALSRLPDLVRPVADSSADAFLRRDPSLPKFILFSAKAAPAPMFKSLAQALQVLCRTIARARIRIRVLQLPSGKQG